MGEGFKRKVGKAFRHRAEALCEARLKERNLFSEQPEAHRTHYRFRLTDPAMRLAADSAVMLIEEGPETVGVWHSNQRIGELESSSREGLQRALAALPPEARAVHAVVQASLTLGGYCQATVRSGG